MSPGLRATKSAKIKVDILKSTIMLLGKKPFSELHVNNICEDIGYSKVTLFKYFSQKDDILLYFWRVWSLELSVELYHNPKEGLSGIYFMFDRLAKTFEDSPGMLLGYVSYVTSLQRPPAPFAIKQDEKILLLPNETEVEKIELFSIPQLLDKFLLDAIFKKQLEGVSDTKSLTNTLLAIIYGSILTVHIRQISSLRLLLRNNMDNVLRQIGATI